MEEVTTGCDCDKLPPDRVDGTDIFSGGVDPKFDGRLVSGANDQSGGFEGWTITFGIVGRGTATLVEGAKVEIVDIWLYVFGVVVAAGLVAICIAGLAAVGTIGLGGVGTTGLGAVGTTGLGTIGTASLAPVGLIGKLSVILASEKDNGGMGGGCKCMPVGGMGGGSRLSFC